MGSEHLLEGALTERILRVFFRVYNELGHGFLESVYSKTMEIALRAEGLEVAREVAVPVFYRGEVVGDFHADMVVARRVIIELKAAKAIDASFEAQTLNYLRATMIEVGLLLNFGPKPEFKRFVFQNDRKQASN